ncbi:MAG: hypothetical protein ACTSRG_01145 [Candidatus Helarchaeota archaeon]
MPKYVCNRCGKEIKESELVQIPICPNCSVGHSPLWRLLKKADDLECPNCSWRAKVDQFPKEPECPSCGNQYLQIKV